MRYGLKRRDFFGLPAGLGWTRAVSAATEKTIAFVPQAMPESLDPIATPSFATRTVAMAVFETLYGTDAQLNPMPQLVAEHRMEEAGRRWVLRLRPDLRFHDGTPVTAADCVASLGRWMKRDRVGLALAARLEAIEATGDDTLTLRLTRRLPRIPLMLTKSGLSPPVIMPARLAASSPFTPVAEIVGSGPFRLANPGWRPGEKLELLRVAAYRPRPEASSFTGGGHVALIDRVVWRAAADPVQALRDGAADWIEWMPPNPAGDQVDDTAVTVRRLDDVGCYALLRLNTARGPTANQRIRQAILAGVDQMAVMETVFGANNDRFIAPVGLFPAGSEFASSAGMDRLGATQSPRAIKARLAEAGYHGEPIVVLNPVDDVVHARMTGAVIDELTQIGLTVAERKLNRQAFATAASEENGDWSALCDSVPCGDQFDPFAISAGMAPGRGPAGTGVRDLWPGWLDDPIAERLRQAWIDAGDAGRQLSLAAQLQTQVFTIAAFVPLGQWFPVTAWRTSVSGQQKGCFPVFWDIARA
jgi:peptide/nickel transport system substrate-binding protein